MAGGTPANPAALAAWIFFWFSFLDEHHRDPVDYRVEDFALRATQVVRFLELHFCVAFRAGEDFEQFLRDHWRMVVRLAP